MTSLAISWNVLTRKASPRAFMPEFWILRRKGNHNIIPITKNQDKDDLIFPLQHSNTYCWSAIKGSWWGLHWTVFAPPRSSTPELRTLGRQGSQNTALVTKNQAFGELNMPLAILVYVLWVSTQAFFLMGTQLDIFHIAKGIHTRTSDPRKRKGTQYNTRHKQCRQMWVDFATSNITIPTVVQQSRFPLDRDSTGQLPHRRGHPC